MCVGSSSPVTWGLESYHCREIGAAFCSLDECRRLAFLLLLCRACLLVCVSLLILVPSCGLWRFTARLLAPLQRTAANQHIPP